MFGESDGCHSRQHCGETWCEPLHALETADDDRIVERLRDLEFVELLCREIGASRLADLYLDAADALESDVSTNLRLMGRAIRRDEAFLEAHPDRLFQQMYNRCWWYDSPEAKHHFVQPFDTSEPPPWEREGPNLCDWMEQWRETWERERGSAWAEARLPVGERIEAGMHTQIPLVENESHLRCVAMDESWKRIFISYMRSGIPERVYDVQSGESVLQFEAEHGSHESGAFGRGGAWLFTGDWEGMVEGRDVRDGEVFVRFDEHEESVQSLMCMTDGEYVASAERGGDIYLWRARSGSIVGRFERHESTVRAMHSTPDGGSIVSRDSDGVVRVWDRHSAREKWCSAETHPSIASVSLGADGEEMLVGCRDGTMRLLEFASGREIWSFIAHESPLDHVALGPDGRRAVSLASDLVRVWDLQTGERCMQIVQPPRRCRDITFVEGGKAIVALVAGSGPGDNDHTDRIERVHWSLELGEPLEPTPRHRKGPSSVAFGDRGDRVIAGSQERTASSARVWRVDDGRLLARLSGYCSSIRDVELFAEGRRAVTGGWSGRTRIWSVETGRKLGDLTCRHSSAGDFDVELDPERGEHLSVSQNISTGTPDTTVRLWDAKRGREVRRWNADDLEGLGTLSDVAYHEPSGLLVLATRSSDSVVAAYDDGLHFDYWWRRRLDSGTLQSHDASVVAVAVDSNGTRVVSGDRDGDIVVWHLREDHTTHRFEGHDGRIHDLAWSPDGQRVISVGERGMLKVWNLESGHACNHVLAHDGPAYSLSLGPSGRYAATGGDDGIVRRWDLWRGVKVDQFEGHERRVWAVAYDPDGRRVFSGSDDGTVRTWSLDDRRAHAVLDMPPEAVTSLEIDDESERLAVGTARGNLWTWDVERDELATVMTGHVNPIECVDVGAETSRLVTVSGRYLQRDSSPVRVRDIETGRDLRGLETMHTPEAEFAHHPEPEQLATHGFAPALRSPLEHVSIQHVSGGTCTELKRPRGDEILQMEFGPRGRYLAVRISPKQIEVWDLEDDAWWHLGETSSDIGAITFDPRGRHFASGHSDGIVRVYSLERRELRTTLECQTEGISSLDIGESGRLASGSEDATVVVSEIETGESITTFGEWGGSVEHLALGDATDRLVAATDDAICLGHVSTDRILWKRENETDSIREVALDEAGERVIAGVKVDDRDEDGAVVAWDLETGEELSRHEWSHLSTIETLRFDPHKQNQLLLTKQNNLQL